MNPQTFPTPVGAWLILAAGRTHHRSQRAP